jgi:hypothetical protein
MKRALAPVLTSLLILGACSDRSQNVAASAAEATAAADSAAPLSYAALKPGAEGAPRTGVAGASASATAPELAYAYRYMVEAPPRTLPALLKRHEQTCADAGPTVCQVVGASARGIGEDRVSGELEIRAEPRWLARFRAGIEGEAKAAGGRLIGASTETEDLSRQIVDTEAALRSKKLLRQRLEGLLSSRNGKLEELVSLERQLAEVQTEIDAAESELAVMRTRVRTSRLTIAYSSSASLAPDSAFRPVSDAFHAFLGNFMAVVGALITLVSFLLPLALVLGPLGWLGLKAWRRRRASKAARDAATDAGA